MSGGMGDKVATGVWGTGACIQHRAQELSANGLPSGTLALRCPGPDEAHKPAQKAARSIPKSCQKKHPLFINCNTYFISTARRNAQSDSTKSYFSNIVFYSYVYYIIFSFI